MKRQLPTIKALSRPEWYHDHIAPSALDRWDPGVQAAQDDEEATINILDVIGSGDFFSSGVTARMISGILRNIGDRPVTVNINSPGGDLFEGIAIYNVLRQHKQDVTVRVLSVAASSASVVAMAGDKVQIAKSGFLMIHNSWVVAQGNRHDLREFADWLEPFDTAIASVYESRTGIKMKKLDEMMDAETWISGADAIKQGFADELLPSDQVGHNARALTEKTPVKAVSLIDSVLASSGLSRSERRSLIAQVKAAKPSAAGQDTQNAVLEENDPVEIDPRDVLNLIATMKG